MAAQPQELLVQAQQLSVQAHELSVQAQEWPVQAQELLIRVHTISHENIAVWLFVMELTCISIIFKHFPH